MSQVRNAPVTVQNVVTYDVLIAVDNPRPAAQARHDGQRHDHHGHARRRAARADRGAALPSAGGCRGRRAPTPPRRRAGRARGLGARRRRRAAAGGGRRPASPTSASREITGGLAEGDRVVTGVMRAAAGGRGAAALAVHAERPAAALTSMIELRDVSQALRPGRRRAARRGAARRLAHHRRRRARRDHGRVGLGQVDAAEHPRLPRPTRRAGTLPARRRRRRAARRRRARRAAQSRASASSSRASTCCRAPRRARTSSCRWSTATCRWPSTARAPRPRSRRWAARRSPSRTPTQLSGGQQQRVAIARALVTHPG